MKPHGSAIYCHAVASSQTRPSRSNTPYFGLASLVWQQVTISPKLKQQLDEGAEAVTRLISGKCRIGGGGDMESCTQLSKNACNWKVYRTF
eukprot:SM000029S10546  [mRNA]  locus=s29:743689:744199:+ [translate_table: standard]